MKPINTIPIEVFMDRVKVASRTNQKVVNIDLKDAIALTDSLNTIMSRLLMKISMETDTQQSSSSVKINADGGGF